MPPQYPGNPDIIIAATLWLMHRYRQTRCRTIAGMVEQHLAGFRIARAACTLPTTLMTNAHNHQFSLNRRRSYGTV